MKAARLLVLALVLAAAGCGKRNGLQLPPNAPAPPKPALAPTPPTVDDLLTPSAEQRPGRSEELLQKSEERPDDRFDLPPPG